MIGCERRTVRRALTGLTDRVDVIQSTAKRYRDTDRFDIILKEPADKPMERSVEQPEDRPLIEPVEQPLDMLAELIPYDLVISPRPQGSVSELIPGFTSMEDTAKMHAIMELHDYSLFDRSRIVELIEQKQFPFPVVSLAEFVRDCNAYHRKSGRKGNAAKLVIYKLEVLLGLRQRTKVTPKSQPDWQAIEQRKAERDVCNDLVDIRIELEHLGATEALTDRVLHRLNNDWTRADYWKALKEVGSDVNNLWPLVEKA